ncbi:MAG: BON domain-containing protein [Proteobacteria bacterium]|nr:BON domain-containing protein [Pseudomonadota bacterium]
MKVRFIQSAAAVAAMAALGCGAAMAQSSAQPTTPAPATPMAQPMTPGTPAGTAPSNGVKNEHPVADAVITTQVKAELAKTDGLKSSSVSVSTHNGEVMLSGTLPSDIEVKKAEAAAKSVKGVTGVNMASLKVDPKGASTADQSSSAGEAVTDAWITTKVKAELATADGVKSTRVSVETNDGVVTLTGVLPTQTAVQKAETVTRAVKGVKKVDAAGLKVKG